MCGTVVVVASGSALAGDPRRDVSLAGRQRAASVRGTVRLSGAASGGRLEVDLRSSGRRAGRLVRTDLEPGSVRFSVSLDARAKRALRLRGQLRVRVQVTVRGLNGDAETVTGTVSLRPA